METEIELMLIKQLSPLVKSKQKVKFWYSDTTKDREAWRIVEPHLIGLNTKDNVVLSAWFTPTQDQIDQGETEGWKQYLLNGIKHLDLVNEFFSKTRPYYDGTDKRMVSIYCATDVVH